MTKGYKTCPGCQAEVGPRTRACKCGHEFEFKPGKAPRTKRKRLQVPESEKPFEALTEAPSEVVGVDDRGALDSFIEQLQTCRDDSLGNGGCYSAFLHCKGGHVIQVEIWLSVEAR